MSQETYNDGYRKGVENALASMAAHNLSSPYIKPTLEEIRKSLLTKKVTKWVIAMKGISLGDEEYIRGRIWDSKSAAERFIEMSLVPSNHVLGIFPLEIEVPL